MSIKNKENNYFENHNYGIDALRIISMFMVTVLHINMHGGAIAGTEFLSVKYELGWFLETASFCATNCFAMISGYVGVESKFKICNIAVLWLRVVYYALGLAVVYLIFLPNVVTKSTFEKALTPVFSEEYWYFTAYFALFFFIPFLNAALNTIEKKKLKYSLISLVFLFSALTTLFNKDVFKTSNGYSTIWLIILYLVGGYIKKYGLFQEWSGKKLICGYFLMVCISWIRKFLSEFIPYKVFGLVKSTGFTMQYISITIFMAGVFLLVFFSRLKPKGIIQKVIKHLAPLSFSVYLIHVNPLIWDNLLIGHFKDYGKLPTAFFPFAIVGTGIAIVLICSVMDYFRELLFRKCDVKGRLFSLEQKINQRVSK